MIYTFRVSAFSFYLKKKTPAKEKQTQGWAPRPRERRAAVHSSRISVSSSAHSHANALELERVRARASCFASRSLALLKKFIKHCGAAIGSLIIKINWVAYFYFAMAKVIYKSQFIALTTCYCTLNPTLLCCTAVYIIEKGTCFCKCLFLAQKERLELSRRFPDLRP